MASQFRTVKLTSDFVEDARAEAGLLRRSLGSQIEHWARLGRAIENAPGFSLDRVRETLTGRLKLEDLSVQEQDSVFERLGAHFQAPSEAVRARYAALDAAGDDENDALVVRGADGRPKLVVLSAEGYALLRQNRKVALTQDEMSAAKIERIAGNRMDVKRPE